jgi:drug/metabolite transporter (DMT)-like permease
LSKGDVSRQIFECSIQTLATKVPTMSIANAEREVKSAVDAVLACSLLLLLLAAGPTLIGFGLYNVSLVYLSSGTTNLVLSLDPLVAAVAAWLLLGERLTRLQALGGAVILTGVAVLARYGRSEEAAPKVRLELRPRARTMARTDAHSG